MTSFKELYLRERALEDRQSRMLLVGYILSVDRNVFPFTASVVITDIGSTYTIPDCVPVRAFTDGTLLGGDVRAAGDAHELREGQTVVVLTPGELDGQCYIIGEILNPAQDGDPQADSAGPKHVDMPLLLPNDTFENGGQLYQRVHNVNGQLGVKLNSDVAPIRFYYHD